jgi:hypothetical protein
MTTMQLLLIELGKKGGNETLLETLKDENQKKASEIWDAEKRLKELNEERFNIQNAIDYLSNV